MRPRLPRQKDVESRAEPAPSHSIRNGELREPNASASGAKPSRRLDTGKLDGNGMLGHVRVSHAFKPDAKADQFHLEPRMFLETQNLVRFKGYVIDRSRWILLWRDEPVTLSRKTFDLLLYLIEQRDRVLHKDELIKALWPKQVVEESNLTQQIFLLRKALSRHESGEKIIETVAGRGYRFIVALDDAPEQQNSPETVVLVGHHSATTITFEEETEVPATGPEVDLPRRRLVVKRRLALIVLPLALAVLSAYAWYTWQSRYSGPPVDVVLADFGNTGDPILDRALNDALRIDLKQSPFLTVLSPTMVTATLGTMRQPLDTPLTPAIAREVCERSSAQVLLQGNVAKFGQKFLVRLRASNCLTEPNYSLETTNGEMLAEVKEEVDQLDDLPRALDGLAAKIRRSLGESRASIRRLDKPLFAVNTGSLAALKAYSEGLRLGRQGNMIDSLLFMQRAVELDPDFGIAYFDIAAAYSTFNDSAHEREFAKKAYSLRDTVPEMWRLYITALYHDVVTGDIAKSIETYQTVIALYPRSPQGFANLAEKYDLIGQAALGVESAQRALALTEANSAVYEILASAQLHAGQPAAARQTCELAISRNLDAVGIRHVLLQSMAVQRDKAGVEAQLAWGRAHKDGLPLLFDEIFIALSKGEVRNAQMLLDDVSKTAPPPELAAQYQSSLLLSSRMLAEEGLTADRLKSPISLPASVQDKNSLVALAEDSEVVRAGEGLRRELQEHGEETLWKNERAPEIQAAIFLAERKPRDAVRVLEPALAFDGLTFGPRYLRGEAYLDLGEADLALKEFQVIVQHQTVDPLSNEYPLAILETARAYAKKGDETRAREQYQRFLDLWKTADPDLPLLRTAKAEFDRMPASF